MIKLAYVCIGIASLFRGISGGAIDPAWRESCVKDEYYRQLDTFLDENPGVEGENLATFLREMVKDHNVIPYTSTNLDVWDALTVLDQDPGNESNTFLIYRNTSVPAEMQGEVTGWNREHVWPKSYGVGYTGPDTSDLHHMRAADWNVNSARNNLFFDECTGDVCSVPAHAEASEDTGKTSTFFMPPAYSRGDIARALFYMEIRYDGSEQYTTNLTLGNCPCSYESRLGRLETLLKWHRDDPPSAIETDRTARVCTDFQGNRNPFVDYPQLVETIFADRPAGQTCSCDAPPEEDLGDGQEGSELGPGDIVLLGFNTDVSKAMSLLVTVDIEPYTTFYVTDEAWLGTSFRSNEGTVKYTAPAEGHSKGTILHWTDEAARWQESGSFTLSTSGDSIIIYQGKSPPTFIFAATYKTGGWDEVAPDSPDASTCVRPSSLTVDAHTIALEHKDNYKYTGIRSGLREDILTAIAQPVNWLGDNTSPFALEDTFTTFQIDYPDCGESNFFNVSAYQCQDCNWCKGISDGCGGESEGTCTPFIRNWNWACDCSSTKEECMAQCKIHRRRWAWTCETSFDGHKLPLGSLECEQR